MSGACICAICYEDVVPASELLQAITVCGHVFHELCLQQWIEFCPNGRKPTCPLCKQNCGARDFHRLYFQSSSDSSPKQDALGIAPSKSPPRVAGASQADRAQFSRLEAKVQMLTNACQASKEQIVELEGKEARYLEQLQALEADRLKGRKEKGQLVESLARTREELRRSSERREELVETNALMAKDLAVYQLANDVNLSEEDMLRLVAVDRGSSANKDDIINMMTKSLYLRNRAFKELMHKCQELGMGESRAEQKSEKLTEQLKRMKARVQELASAEEEKENAEMRSLTRSIKPVRSPNGTARKVLSSRNDGNSAGYQPNLSENVVSLSQKSVPQKVGERKEAGQKSPIVIGLDDTANTLEAQVQGAIIKKPALVVGCMDTVPATQSGNGERNLAGTNWKNSCQLNSDYSTEFVVGQAPPARKDSLSNSNWVDGGMDSSDPHVLSDIQAQDSGRSTVGPPSEPPSHEESYLNVRPSMSQSVRPKMTIGLDGDIDDVEVLGRGPMLPIRQELGLGQAAASFLRPQSMTGGQTSGTPVPSTFIVSGADGRGGRVTVLKPPRLFPGGGGSSLLGAQRAKRFKSTSQISGSRPAALKIEHFFGRG